MSRSRPVTGLLLALTLALVGASLFATSASAAVEPKIWGVVVDGKGRPVLDVVVTAVDRDGEIVSSDLSYEGGDAEDSPRQGYFQLFPGSNGTYAVTFKKQGFASETIADVKIVAGKRVRGLGDIALLRKTKTSGKLVDSSVTVGDRGKVKVTVTPAGEKPTGDVKVKSGRKVVGSGELRAKNKGELTISLKKLDRGSYDLKVTYDGSEVLKGSTSDKFTLKVTKPNRHRQVPNALAYVG